MTKFTSFVILVPRIKAIPVTKIKAITMTTNAGKAEAKYSRPTQSLRKIKTG